MLRSNIAAHPYRYTVATHPPSACLLVSLAQTVQDCTADIGGGVFSDHRAQMELVNCHILRCHATSSGGGLCVWTQKCKITGGTISGCSAKKGGGVHMFGPPTYEDTFYTLINVLVTNCRATGKQEDEGGGGILVSGGARLKMSGGLIQDCAAQYEGGGGGGGLRVMDSASQVWLSGMALQRCTAMRRGGCMRIDEGDLSLLDVSLEECGLELMCVGAYAINQARGTLRAERVRVGRPNPKFELPNCGIPTVRSRGGNSEWTDSTISDCPGSCLMLDGGTHAVVRTSFLRSNADKTSGAVSFFASSILTMTNSYIADSASICLLGSGVAVLRNTTLHNCSARAGDNNPYIGLESLKTAINFQAELLTLELSCREGSSTALINDNIHDTTTIAGPLNVRGLRIVAPEACANFSVFRDGVRPVSCSDDKYSPCAAAATCTEVPPLLSVPTLKTVDCSCEGGKTNQKATSPALAPYGFNPSTIGLPGERIDYCVRCGPLKPQTATSGT